MQRRAESRLDDKSDDALPGYAPTYSLTEEDVALWSASAGLGAHTSRCAASGGDAARPPVRAPPRRAFPLFPPLSLRRLVPLLVGLLVQGPRMCPARRRGTARTTPPPY